MIPQGVRKQVDLAQYTSWLVGGPADYFCLPKNIEELKEFVLWAQAQKLPVTVLGGGSNVLIADKGVRGLVICLRQFSGLQGQADEKFLKIEALAGTGKSDLLKVFLKHRLAPALFLAGLPGDVGGGVVMNAGVAENFVPREFGQIVEWVDVLKTDSPELAVVRFKHQELDWQYRHSFGWQPGIVVKCGLRWAMEPIPDILEQVKLANRSRLAKQPLDMPSCGSVFVNPEGHKAAMLIDQSGLKGRAVGDAQVSIKHANFIVNTNKARAVDIAELIGIVQKEVFEKTGVALKTEVVYLGDW